ncbi:MAG: ACT domain-containing protein [Chloroflexota bacterium]
MSKGEKDIRVLLQNINPILQEGVYVFVTCERRQEQDLKPNAICRFVEEEGVTLIMLKDEAEHLGFDYIFPCQRITLNIHSSLEAVGFLAAISKELTAAGISSNVISAYYHDHLFISNEQVDEAMNILNAFREK